MSIVIVGIDLGKNSCSIVVSTAWGQWWCDGDCVVTASSPSRRSCRPASWLWRRVAALITWDGRWQHWDMRSG